MVNVQSKPKRNSRSRRRRNARSSGTTNIVMSQRKNDFNDKTWWLVDTNPIGGEEMISRQGASPLIKRCMSTHGWSETKARKVLNAYRQFLSLKKETKDWHDDNILSPCYLVEQMWRSHILDVVNYCHDMMLLCGHVLGYNPDGALDHVEKQRRDETTHAKLLERFGSQYDKEMWGFSSSSSRQMIQRVQKDHKMSSSRQIQRAQKEQNMSSKFMIYVKFHDKTMSFWVKSTDTIGHVKDAIQQKRNISSHLQRLTYGFKSLDDARTLDDCNITKECTLHLCRIYSKTTNRSYRCKLIE